MLIEFTIENFKSFKDRNVFSLIATKDQDKYEKQVVQLRDKVCVLKNAAILGANASGKSNILDAIKFMKNFVINSSKESQLGDNIEIEPFKFNTATEGKSSVFEVVFFYENVIYRYGFEANEKKVNSEWLFARYSSRESQLFIREDQIIDFGSKFKEGKLYKDSVRENALFLSVCAQFNGAISTNILRWFRKLNIISNLKDNMATTLKILSNDENKFEDHRKKLISLIKGIDVGIQDVSLNQSEETDFEKILDRLPTKVSKDFMKNIEKSEKDGKKHRFNVLSIDSLHNVFDENGTPIKQVNYDFSIESVGTQKVLDIAGPIIETMFNGGILFIDEIQNSLHTKLVTALVNFFVNNNIKSNAQFIFTTHDVNILAEKILRRDQLWFVEKNRFGESELTCLVDFDEHVRKDANLDRDYLRGRYGAIPYISLEDLYGDR